jgi:hypothetical protein
MNTGAPVGDSSSVEGRASLDLSEFEERVRRDGARSSMTISILFTSILFALVYGLSWRLNVTGRHEGPRSQGGPSGPVIPVADPGKLGFAVDLGDGAEEADDFFEEAALAAAAPALDPLNILQAAEQNQFNDAPLGALKRGQLGGPIGRDRNDRGPDGPAVRRSDRWVIEWGNDTETGYRRKLDHFGIYLGAVRGGQLVGAVRGFESDRRQETVNPPRLWFIHQDRTRVETDRRLLTSARVPVLATDVVAQFFPAEVQERLASLEAEFSHKNVSEINRTVFGIRAAGAGYEFYVIEQQLK